MLGDALSYPRNSSDWIPTILIGGILIALTFLILPAFILQGYAVRVMRSAAAGEGAAPSFTDWGSLLVDGLKLFVITVAYGLVVLIPAIAVLVTALSVFSVSTSPPSEPSAALSAVGLLGPLLVGLLGVLVGYFGPAGYANFAREGSLGAAFDVSTIFAGAATGEYLKAWLAAVVLGAVLGLLGTGLSLAVVGIFVLFYAQVVTHFLFGRGFAAGLEGPRRSAVGPEF